MKKILLTILLCGVMILGVTGCGTKSNSLSAEEQEKVIRQIEAKVLSEKRSEDSGLKRNSYEANVTDIQVEDMTVTFSGKLYIKYVDGSENKTATFSGTCDYKGSGDLISIYHTKIDYNL